MASIRAVIFDLDGVLVDARAWHYRALSRALADCGAALTPEEHAARYEALPTREKLRLLTAEKGFPEALHARVWELKQRYTTELIETGCAPRAAHVDMMARLKAEGYKLAVASNSARRTLDLVLTAAGLLPHLDAVVSCQDVARPKPAPDVYAEACARLGVAPADCLVLEDHPVGLEAAAGAGARVAAVAGPDEVCYAFVRRKLDEAAGGA